jgi:hypothetical protein
MRDSDPRTTALASTINSCKLQTRPLAREGAPHKRTSYSSDSKINLIMDPSWVPVSKKIYFDLSSSLVCLGQDQVQEFLLVAGHRIAIVRSNVPEDICFCLIVTCK